MLTQAAADTGQREFVTRLRDSRRAPVLAKRRKVIDALAKRDRMRAPSTTKDTRPIQKTHEQNAAGCAPCMTQHIQSLCCAFTGARRTSGGLVWVDAESFFGTS